MKRKLLVSLFLALSLCLVCALALAAEPVYSLTFDSTDEDFTLGGGAVLEDGVVKLPGGDMRKGGYVELPYAALMDTDDQATISMWMYIPADTATNTYFVSFSNGNSWPAFSGRVLPKGNVAINFDNRGIMMTEPVVPTDAWTHLTLSISKSRMKLYLNGERVAMYDGAMGIMSNCGWYKINGADVGTTHYHELDKVSLPSGFLGTPTYNFYYELDGDSMAMFDEWAVYDVALSDDEVAELYAGLTCPAATWPIGSPADPEQKAAEIVMPEVPEDGLRVKLTFDDEDEMYTLYNNASVEDGVLNLPGGEFRKAGHLELPDHAIAECANAMTVSTWINVDNFGIGDQWVYAISAGEAWPSVYLMTWGDGSLHYNVDFRGQLNSNYCLPAGKWVYLTSVISAQEVSLYADGVLLSKYDRASLKTTGGTWEMLNVQSDSTHFCDIDRAANKTFRIGSAFMDIGYNRVDMKGKMDNFSIYSKALTADEVAALYDAECQETGYNK